MSNPQNFLSSVANSIQQAGSTVEDHIVSSVSQVMQAAKNGVNRTGEAVSDFNDKANAVLEPIMDKVMGVEHDPMEKYPNYVRSNQTARTVLGSYKPETLPATMPDTIQGYRADPQGKFGGQDGLETQPTNFRSNDLIGLYGRVRALAAAKKYGAPQLSAQELTALALKEGMSSMGALRPDSNHTAPIADKLQADGVDSLSSYFPALVAEKKKVADRLGIPFAAAWNGTGHSYSDSNSTGADYARNYSQYYMKAALHPKNRQLYNFIQSALSAGK